MAAKRSSPVAYYIPISGGLNSHTGVLTARNPDTDRPIALLRDKKKPSNEPCEQEQDFTPANPTRGVVRRKEALSSFRFVTMIRFS